MSVAPEEARNYLNLSQDEAGAELNLTLIVDAANAWVASKVTDTTAAPVKLATLELIRHWWEVQRGPSAAPLDEDYVDVSVMGYGIPNRVKQMLDPYMTATAGPSGAGSFPCAAPWPDPVEPLRGW